MQRATLAISCLALFVALGGPSQAQKITSALKKNEVKTQHIRNGHVISSDLKDNAIKSIDVKDGALAAVDIAKSQGVLTRDFASIGGRECDSQLVASGIAGGGDHLLLAPEASEYNLDDVPVVFYATAPIGAGSFGLVGCNVSNGAVDPPPIDFRYLVIEG